MKRSAGENMYLSFLSDSRKDQEKGKDKNLRKLLAKNVSYEKKKLWKNFPDDKKPEWLTYEEILEYESKMVENDIFTATDEDLEE